jgi:putative FmdB family regulatory protein
VKCREKFELRRRIDDSDSDLRCPKCEAENPKRIISAFATGSNKGACASSSPT